MKDIQPIAILPVPQQPTAAPRLPSELEEALASMNQLRSDLGERPVAALALPSRQQQPTASPALPQREDVVPKAFQLLLIDVLTRGLRSRQLALDRLESLNFFNHPNRRLLLLEVFWRMFSWIRRIFL